MMTLFGSVVLALAFVSSAADMAGGWTIAAKIGEMDVPLTCTFVQEGEKLTGNCKGPGAPPEGLPITGETKGPKATWSYNINFQGTDLHLTYTAEVDAAAMKGEINVSGQASGTFTGKKDAK